MDSEPLEPLNIDDRSPGEKMLASGRVGMSRVGELVDEQRLDVAALVWMICTVTFTGVEIYQAFHLFGASGFNPSTWDKIAALGQTGGPLVAMSCLVGIALAITTDSAVARWSIIMAGVLGAWVFVAGIFDFASNVHRSSESLISFNRGNRGAGAIGALALAGLGLVVMMIAWRTGGARPDPAPELS
jgi:hypothetical protein